MKKFLTIISLVFMLTLTAGFGFACMGNNTDENDDNLNFATVNFYTEKGSLSFTQKTLDSKFLKESDCPKVTYNGNDYVFDYWADSLGNKFNFNTEIKQNISLYAKFDAYELVCYTSWNKGESFYKYKDGYDFYELNYKTNSSKISTLDYGRKQMRTKKVLHKEVVAQNYLTFAEFESMSSKNVFKTTSSYSQIVKKTDITDDVYEISLYYVFGEMAYGIKDYVLVGTLPSTKNLTTPMPLKSYVFTKEMSEFETNFTGSTFYDTKGPRFMEKPANLSYSDFTFQNIGNQKTIEQASVTDFKKDKEYYVFNRMKFWAIGKEGADHNTINYAFDVNGKYYSGISNAELEAIKQ